MDSKTGLLKWQAEQRRDQAAAGAERRQRDAKRAEAQQQRGTGGGR